MDTAVNRHLNCAQFSTVTYLHGKHKTQRDNILIFLRDNYIKIESDFRATCELYG